MLMTISQRALLMMLAFPVPPSPCVDVVVDHKKAFASCGENRIPAQGEQAISVYEYEALGNYVLVQYCSPLEGSLRASRDLEVLQL